MKKYKKYLTLLPLAITIISMFFFQYAFTELAKNERNIKLNTTFAIIDNLQNLAMTVTLYPEQIISIIEYVDTAYYMTYAAVYDANLRLLTKRFIEPEARGSLDPRVYSNFINTIRNNDKGIIELDFQGIHYYIKFAWIDENLLAIGISDLSIYDFKSWAIWGTGILLTSMIILQIFVVYNVWKHNME